MKAVRYLATTAGPREYPQKTLLMNAGGLETRIRSELEYPESVSNRVERRVWRSTLRVGRIVTYSSSATKPQAASRTHLSFSIALELHK
jgi:hypothetical protein